MNSTIHFKRSALRSAIVMALSVNGAALALSIGDAQATQSAVCGAYTPLSPNNSANFTMLAGNGGVVGGTNKVAMTWDGTAYNASSDYIGPGSVANVTASSTTPFFGHPWTAHDIQLFGPGSYSFDTTVGGGNPEAGTLNATVSSGELGMHMLFDWNGNNNIDVFVVLAQNSVFNSGLLYSTQTNSKGQFKCSSNFTGTITQNCLYDGTDYGNAGAPTKNQTWMLASIVNTSSVGGVAGIPMATGGPFAGFNANFNFRGSLTLTANTPCNPVTATPFTFTPVTGATPNTQYVSNTITVGGLGGASATISIAGGQYSLDGGTTWTSTNGTVLNGATVKVRQTSSANADGTTTNASLTIGGTSGAFSVTVVNEKPNAFSFTSVPGATPGTTYVSNLITVGGMDTGVSTPISITVGDYSKNGGAFTNAADTVQNGDTIAVRVTATAGQAIATLTLGSAGNGTLVTGTFTVTASKNSLGNNFTMIDSTGSIAGGTNDVVMTWDSQCETSATAPVTAAIAHMQLSSVTPFFGHNWTAHHIRVFCPGTYTINVDCTTAQLEAGTCAPNANAARNYTFTVGANQIGGDMLFDWNGTTNINVVEVWDYSNNGASPKVAFSPSPLFTGAQGFNAGSTLWDLMSTDTNASCPGAVDGTGSPINCGVNGVNGTGMINGPFLGFSANFNLNLSGALSASNYTPSVKVASPSNSPGCSISPKPVNTLERADWWLVAGFLTWLGGIRTRLKRKTPS